MLKNVLKIAVKEFNGFFASPAALIFLGAFLGVTLFVFFWVETFFARNIADVRPLFEWMPVLLIFLVAAITMRTWSEERLTGTLALLLTSPVPPIVLVLGKFAACVALVGVALLLTLPVPLTVAYLGSIDWGPVIGGYLATLFLASAYVSIGLCVSARSDNAIVSLIGTALVCGVFFMIGSDQLTGLFGIAVGEKLKLLGSASRFESITRGVLDLRDLYYYGSLVGVFLTLNVLGLEWIRWAGNPSNARHRRWGTVAGLLVVNFVVGNLWLASVGFARIDMTKGNIYSISSNTREYIDQLREPLLVRGYFSAQTHPLLSPLVPRLRDLLLEYAQVGDGRVRVEFIDPVENPELEEEAGEKFGIRPVTFQVADKYQAAVVNSYFDVVIQYGDEYETLGFRELIEVRVGDETDIEVDLRNPEYAITRAIKKVLYAYQASGDLFASMREPVQFVGYSSAPDLLPPALVEVRTELDDLLQEFVEESDGKFSFEFVDPTAGAGELAQELQRDFGFRPMMAGLFDPRRFWFYLVLRSGDQLVQLAVPEDPSRAELERTLEAGLRRFSPGMIRTVALDIPQAISGHGFQEPPIRLDRLQSALEQEHAVLSPNLTDGEVPAEADILVVVAPRSFSERQLFAVDQFLMRGGTVILATSPIDVQVSGRLNLVPRESGLEAWLQHHGITVRNELVADRRSAPFPIPVQRRVGGLVVQETQMVDYPYFIDVREDGLASDTGLFGGVQQVTMHWTSPIDVDADENAERTVTPLLESSPESWAVASPVLVPSAGPEDDFGLRSGEPLQPHLLATVIEGRFTSYFEGERSPLVPEPVEGDEDEAASDEDEPAPISRVIDRSPESARLIVFASNEFLMDEMLELSSGGMRTEYNNPVQMIANAVDWSLEDRGLLGIGGRAQFSRTLAALERDEQVFWEYLNYGLAGAGLILLWLLRARADRRRQLRYAAALSAAGS